MGEHYTCQYYEEHMDMLHWLLLYVAKVLFLLHFRTFELQFLR